MHFGFLLPNIIDRSDRDPFGATRRLCQLAENVGFDFVVIGQHRFTPRYFSTPLQVLTAIAAVTQRLRLCTGIVILPLHHPLEIAEQVAQLDEISGGRAVLGVGIGYRRYEFDALGVPYEERVARTEAALDLIPRAWTALGDDESVPNLVPRPLQTPHPPIWVGARAGRAMERAARLGDGWMTGLSQPVSELAEVSAAYRSAPPVEGRGRDVCLMRQLGIGETQQQVEAEWLEPVLRFYTDYWDAGARADKDPTIVAKVKAGDPVTLREFAEDRAIAGVPSECADQVRQYVADVAATHLCVVTQATHESAAARSIELFGRHVIPAVR